MPESQPFASGLAAVREERRLGRALARARATARAAQSRGETPSPSLLTRIEELQRARSDVSHTLAFSRGKIPRQPPAIMA